MATIDEVMGFVKAVRGDAPEGMPGAERFSPDYDGPMPKGRTKGNFPEGFTPDSIWTRDDRMRVGFIESVRGKAPKGMPGAERFSRDYDGPVPER